MYTTRSAQSVRCVKACRTLTSARCALSQRHFTRGIPYTPVGTIQDFTASPRHVGLPELQRQQDLRSGRAPTGLYKGPTITTATGVRPLFSPGDHANHSEPSQFIHMQRGETQRRGGASRDSDSCHTMCDKTSSFADQLMSATSSSMGYQQDIRTDPRYDDVPEHIRAARQSMLAMQSDSAGEGIRGIVPPPPARDPAHDVIDSSYAPPRVQLGDAWWGLLVSFLVALMLMMRYGH